MLFGASIMTGIRIRAGSAAVLLCLSSFLARAQTNPAPSVEAPTGPIVRSVRPIQIQAAPAMGQIPPTVLAFDATTKQDTVTQGTQEAVFDFHLTNVSPAAVTINMVATSCGCTAAKLPEQPWVLAPGSNGTLHVTMNLLAKPPGTTQKTVTLFSDKGDLALTVISVVEPAPGGVGMQMTRRGQNKLVALVNRQAVFQNAECAKCHAEPGKDKLGQALYTAVCGVCHEAEHRATEVPNLHQIAEPTGPSFWRNWIVNGKAGTEMPAFSRDQGGPLSEPQIGSLVDYLAAAIPSRAGGSGTNAPGGRP
jgi:mono/diheme cytochrome c family protein